MKLSHVTSLVLVGLGTAAGCSQGSLPSGNTQAGGSGAQSGMGQTSGGTGGASGGTGGASGGTVGTSGGTGGTGGTTGGSGGTGGSAATVGGGAGMMMSSGGASTAGTTGVGGTGGDGMATGGGAGTGLVGAGGSNPGTGGMAGGNSMGGAPPMGGNTSVAGNGAGGGSGGLSATDIVPDLQGFYWEGTCSGSISVDGHNCPFSDGASCPTNGVDRTKTVMVKGTAGQLYTINIEVRGVIGTRCYTGGTAASTAALNEDGNNNWWYAGGSYANPTGWWNTYELHVSPSTGDASGDVYYFNGSGVQGGNDCEREASYLVKYTASFKVKGGGTLTFKTHDQNCKVQQNCGKNPDGSSPCAPRTVDLTGMAAQPPSGFTQPPADGQYKPQWMLIAVTAITSP
jgi:hypothetical protein